LEPNDLHVWRFGLSPPEERLMFFHTLLSDDEQKRARRFHFDHDRHAYTTARGLLRLLIGNYQQCDPATVEIRTGKFGKPELAGGRLKFNIAHSDGLGLAAFSRAREVGVDIERADPEKCSDGLARRSFSDIEYRQYASISGEQKSVAFFNGWTRKEAFIKATGKGLSYPLDTFDVSLLPDREARLERVNGSREQAVQWSMWALTPDHAYHGAVVVRGTGCRLSRFHFPVNLDD
jgi:4'-phosphopantetheinyl transferase